MAKPTMTQAVMETYGAIEPALPPLYLEDIPEDVQQLRAAYYVHQGETPIAGAYPTGAAKPVMLDGRFAIVLFSTDSDQLETWARQVMQAFTVDSLDMDSGQQTTLFRGTYQLQGTKLRDKDGNPVYMAQVPYLCKIGNPAA